MPNDMLEAGTGISTGAEKLLTTSDIAATSPRRPPRTMMELAEGPFGVLRIHDAVHQADKDLKALSRLKLLQPSTVITALPTDSMIVQIAKTFAQCYWDAEPGSKERLSAAKELASLYDKAKDTMFKACKTIIDGAKAAYTISASADPADRAAGSASTAKLVEAMYDEEFTIAEIAATLSLSEQQVASVLEPTPVNTQEVADDV